MQKDKMRNSYTGAYKECIYKDVELERKFLRGLESCNRNTSL